MWKVLIADDEPKIRYGLKNFINWDEFDMQIVGEAEDGEIAYDLAVELKPDLMLVDINMPFLNGLELIEKVKQALPKCILIVVTGHDEFSFAQKALRLQVYDYLLKPVSRVQMNSVLDKVREELKNIGSTNEFLGLVKNQLDKNLPYLKENFLRDLVSGRIDDEEIEKQMNFFHIKFVEKSGMLVIRIVDKFNVEKLTGERDRQNSLAKLENIVQETLDNSCENYIFTDIKDNIVIITPIINQSEWFSLGDRIQKAAEKQTNETVIVSQKLLGSDIKDISRFYEELIKDLNTKGEYTPIVLLAKKYIDFNYHKVDISLQEVAEEVQASPTYLSRLLKQEIGVSFVEYLTQVRVRKAIQLMSDPMLKIYEIAEKVGYCNQHYFSTAFKKVVEVSPAEYRRSGYKFEEHAR